MNELYIQRFWSYVDKSKGENECWEWIGGRSATGYGVFGMTIEPNNQKLFGAHRLAWELAYGDIPNDMLICHHCDNRKCCNPKHLFLGTQKDNSQDMVHKGRAGTSFGEKAGNAKLTNEQVKEIRELYGVDDWDFKTLGKRYDVHETTIKRIVQYRSRKRG